MSDSESFEKIHAMGDVFDDVFEDTEDRFFDEVNKPEHYNSGTIETFVYICDVMRFFHPLAPIWGCHWQVLKYLSTRLWSKGDAITNAKKARWYLNKMIEMMEETEGKHW
tara:strand:+ start:736 stop:1065 length:330 start_codon:yes stop_codon:yes gene_type:complete